MDIDDAIDASMFSDLQRLTWRLPAQREVAEGGAVNAESVRSLRLRVEEALEVRFVRLRYRVQIETQVSHPPVDRR